MNQIERFYKIDQLLNERTVIPFKDLQEGLEISRATLKRDLAYLRDRLNAPIIFDRDAGGYVTGNEGRACLLRHHHAFGGALGIRCHPVEASDPLGNSPH